MPNRREKNHRDVGPFEDGNRNIVKKNPDQENKYANENFNSTDTDAAEDNPRIKHASQVSGNSIEEGDEDYDDEEENKKI